MRKNGLHFLNIGILMFAQNGWRRWPNLLLGYKSVATNTSQVWDKCLGSFYWIIDHKFIPLLKIAVILFIFLSIKSIEQHYNESLCGMYGKEDKRLR